MTPFYDIIIVGAGHAGSEAAIAAANMGSKVLLITIDMEKIAAMSCNPAVGGIAKGQIVREIDALGGSMGIISDKSAIQFRMLNKSKGPAVWSPRVQSDRRLYSFFWRRLLENNKNIDLFNDNVQQLIIERNTVVGVKTEIGVVFRSKSVILTNGTFLNGKIFVGTSSFEGGRISERNNNTISAQIAELGFTVKRLKTGTPVRIDSRSIDFSKLLEQKGDEKPTPFSFIPHIKPPQKQKSCWIAYTNSEVHKILEKGFYQSPLFTGAISGIGPRYCPSIEDKIVTFKEKEQHQLFFEPEGWNTAEYYLNGFSSSLSWNIQLEALQKILGFKNARIFRPGYAIEYDFFDPLDLNHTLETKKISNLYFAGQINGTTGYEEAAAQGIVAGINATLKIQEKSEFVMGRDQSYIGVLIDDLVTKGINDPYRMFTSRAEYRILLRQDNADERLTLLGYNIGLASSDRLKIMEDKYNRIYRYISYTDKTGLYPEDINEFLVLKKSTPLTQKTKISKIIIRPEVTAVEINQYCNFSEFLNFEELESVDIRLKYQGYIEKERNNADKLRKFNEMEIPETIDYTQLNSLSTEAVQKLIKFRPKTIGNALRISGINPSDIIVLLIHLGR